MIKYRALTGFIILEMVVNYAIVYVGTTFIMIWCTALTIPVIYVMLFTPNGLPSPIKVCGLLNRELVEAVNPDSELVIIFAVANGFDSPINSLAYSPSSNKLFQLSGSSLRPVDPFWYGGVKKFKKAAEEHLIKMMGKV